MKRVAKHKRSAGLGRRTQGSGPLKRVRSTEGRRALFADDGGRSGFFDSLKEASSDASFLHFRIFVKVSERALPEIRESDIIGVS